MNSYTSSGSFTFTDFINKQTYQQEHEDKSRNPNGSDKHAIRLDNFVAGEITILRQFLPGMIPVQVGKMIIKEGENRLSLDGGFKGVIAGKSKDPTKKFELVYVGFSEEEKKNLTELENKVNKI